MSFPTKLQLQSCENNILLSHSKKSFVTYSCLCACACACMLANRATSRVQTSHVILTTHIYMCVYLCVCVAVGQGRVPTDKPFYMSHIHVCMYVLVCVTTSLGHVTQMRHVAYQCQCTRACVCATAGRGHVAKKHCTYKYMQIRKYLYVFDI